MRHFLDDDNEALQEPFVPDAIVESLSSPAHVIEMQSHFPQ
jgi:hypothetical protein